MPNFDGGHYFLSTLAPIRVGAPIDLPEDQRSRFEGDPTVSFVSRVQQALSDMPTALQSPATEEIGVPSPFSTSLRTHFCRFVVIEDAVYNGRLGDNPLLTSAGLREQPLEPKHVDHLPCAYLMCCLDFDAVKQPGDPLPNELTEAEQDAIRDHYLEAMWSEGGAELTEIYENCQEFDPDKIRNPKEFAAYIRKCQFETWMSYNDYYVDAPDLPALPLKAFAAAILLPLAVMVWCLAAWLIGFETVFGLASGWTGLIAGAVLAAAAYGVYRYIIAAGQKPWPAAPDGDLPSVLKGLYLQQRFADFVIGAQGATPDQLHDAFGDFLKTHKPDDSLDPATTQAPGVIKS